jgi:hypothetical protein
MITFFNRKDIHPKQIYHKENDIHKILEVLDVLQESEDKDNA